MDLCSPSCSGRQEQHALSSHAAPTRTRVRPRMPSQSADRIHRRSGQFSTPRCSVASDPQSVNGASSQHLRDGFGNMNSRGSQQSRMAPHQSERICSLDDLDVRTEFVAETLLPTKHGRFRLRGYRHSVRAGPLSQGRVIPLPVPLLPCAPSLDPGSSDVHAGRPRLPAILQAHKRFCSSVGSSIQKPPPTTLACAALSFTLRCPAHRLTAGRRSRSRAPSSAGG